VAPILRSSQTNYKMTAENMCFHLALVGEGCVFCTMYSSTEEHEKQMYTLPKFEAAKFLDNN
jgi:hypothetical protein